MSTTLLTMLSPSPGGTTTTMVKVNVKEEIVSESHHQALSESKFTDLDEYMLDTGCHHHHHHIGGSDHHHHHHEKILRYNHNKPHFGLLSSNNNNSMREEMSDGFHTPSPFSSPMSSPISPSHSTTDSTECLHNHHHLHHPQPSLIHYHPHSSIPGIHSSEINHQSPPSLNSGVVFDLGASSIPVVIKSEKAATGRARTQPRSRASSVNVTNNNNSNKKSNPYDYDLQDDEDEDDDDLDHQHGCSDSELDCEKCQNDEPIGPPAKSQSNKRESKGKKKSNKQVCDFYQNL